MEAFIERFVSGPLSSFLDMLGRFLPKLLEACLVLAAGVVLSKVLEFVFRKVIAALGGDSRAEKSGMMDMLRKGGVKATFSALVAKVLYWALVVMFLIIALRTLDVPQVETLLSGFFMYLPAVAVAIAVVFIGYALSEFLSKLVLVTAVNSGLRMSGVLSKATKAGVMLLAVTIAMEQLCIGHGAVLVIFAILVGGVVLAFSLAFGLGGREIARDYLEGKLKGKEEEKDEISHL